MTTFRAESIYTAPMTQVGPPVAGDWLKGTTIVDTNGQHWNCVTSGTPGTWVGGDTATSPQQMVYVAKNGRLLADGGTGAFENPFLTIQGAIDSIMDAATGKRYVVKVAPGVYAENVTMKSYVFLEGNGPVQGFRPAVQIQKSDGVNALVTLTGSTLKYSGIKNLLVYNTGGVAVAINGDAAGANLTLDNVSVVGSTYGVMMTDTVASGYSFLTLRGSYVSGTTKAINGVKSGAGTNSTVAIYDSTVSCSAGCLSLPADYRVEMYNVALQETTPSVRTDARVQILSMVSDPSAYVVGELVGDTSTPTRYGRVKAKRTGATHELLVVPIQASLLVAGNIVGTVTIAATAVSALCGGLTAYTAAAGIQTSSPQLVKVGPNEKFTKIQDAIDSITDAASTKKYVIEVASGVYTESLVMKSYVLVKGLGSSLSTLGSVRISPPDGMPCADFGAAGSTIYNCRMEPPACTVATSIVVGSGIYLQDCYIRSTHAAILNVPAIRLDSIGQYYLNLTNCKVVSIFNDAISCQATGSGPYGTITLDGGFLTSGTGKKDINVTPDVAVNIKNIFYNSTKYAGPDTQTQILTMSFALAVDYIVGEIVTDTAGKTGRVRQWRKGTTNELVVVPTTSTLLIVGVITGATSGAVETASAVSVLAGGINTYYGVPPTQIQTSSPQLVRVGPNEKFTKIQDAIDSITDAAYFTKPYVVQVSDSGRYTENVTLKTGIDLRGVPGNLNGTILLPSSLTSLTVPSGAVCTIEGFYVDGATVISGTLESVGTVFERGNAGDVGNVVTVNNGGSFTARGGTLIRAMVVGHTGIGVANGGTFVAEDMTFNLAGGGIAIDAVAGSTVTVYGMRTDLAGSTLAGTFTVVPTVIMETLQPPVGAEALRLDTSTAALVGTPIRAAGYVQLGARVWNTAGATSIYGTAHRLAGVVDTIDGNGVPLTYHREIQTRAGAELWRISETGVVAHQYGSALLPTISFSGDLNSGVFHPAIADNIGIATGGLQRVIVDDNGLVGIGVTTPYNHILLEVGTNKTDMSATHQVAIYAGLKSNAVANGAGSFNAGFETSIGTIAGAQTLELATNYSCGAMVKGAGTTITRTIGFSTTDETVGTHNAAISDYSAAFTGDWFIHYPNTRSSYLGGKLSLGTTDVSGMLNIRANNLDTFIQSNTGAVGGYARMLLRNDTPKGFAFMVYGSAFAGTSGWGSLPCAGLAVMTSSCFNGWVIGNDEAYPLIFITNGTERLRVSSDANGATAVGITSSSIAYSTAGAKLWSFKNATVEKVYIDKDGVVNGSGFAVGATPGVSGTITAANTVTVVNGIVTAIV